MCTLVYTRGVTEYIPECMASIAEQIVALTSQLPDDKLQLLMQAIIQDKRARTILECEMKLFMFEAKLWLTLYGLDTPPGSPPKSPPPSLGGGRTKKQPPTMMNPETIAHLKVLLEARTITQVSGQVVDGFEVPVLSLDNGSYVAIKSTKYGTHLSVVAKDGTKEAVQV